MYRSSIQKAKEYHQKALLLRIEIGDRKGDAGAKANGKAIFYSLDDNVKAKGYIEEALAIQK